MEFSIPSQVGTHRNEFLFLFSLFLSLSHLILALKKAIIVFFSFLNFFAIFLEFSIPGWVGTRQNDFLFIYFHSLLAFYNLFWHEMKQYRSFFIYFLFFLFFFLEFSITCRVFIIFISLFLSLAQLVSASKRSPNGVLQFFESFSYVFESFYFRSGRNSS